MVHFMYHLDWAKGFQRAGETLLSGVPVRVFRRD